MSELSFQGTTECIKKASSIGEDLYYNICTGQSTAVPWGAMDWAGNLFVLSLLCTIVGSCIFVLCSIVHNRFF